ncbi:MAG: acetyl-CoA acetyltransferase [Actinobacteria bacterium]|nr:acetyl-CoA acetyltransferase [Actinomycetota bacterium]MCG2820064.1 acetyl-CoA acetyltransferase [Actinomycetes bacterium]MBU4219482.1 acetyl-CoA acetyltransferase [Actinomycetota bacterium]MBU4357901.1 acetyl-CoA acetyltransferase [Actinomycetota bacterium]MBU4393311.1 acetyl-CoA acetyltransferase [Actinomycetota bacterium]
MAEGIRDKVVILGMGCTKFGEQWEANSEDLAIESFNECLKDAKIEKKDVQAAWLGSHIDEVNIGKGGNFLGLTLHLPLIPITRTENFCASGTEAFRGAAYGVASGAYDIALALGVEKLKDTGYGGLPDSPAFGQMATMVMPNATAPGMFAQIASAYSAEHGVSMERIKEAMAHVSWKSHQNGLMNPRAHLRKAVTIEQIMGSPIIAYPLGLFDCCGVSDGSAAAIVTTPEIARKIKPNEDLVKVKALQISVSSGEEQMYTDWDGAGMLTTKMASKKAYEEAGITNPREEISMMEVHDCFSITELATMEDLGISAPGKATDDILDGFFDLDGQLPCQTDGGLKCFGHPIGASGLRMIYEMYSQLLRRWPEERLVKDPHIALTHNLGGVPNQNVCSIAIMGLD